MSIKEDVKSVISELSPIIAGFKLAVIVIGYFGFGSVAKWIISYWYPFTRWIWDQVANLLSFPEFPVIVKDSLTALIFFMPLGITAILHRVNGQGKDDGKHRISSALFGFLFLFLICKDVISAISKSLSSSLDTFKQVEIPNIILEFSTILDGHSAYLVYFYLGLILLYFTFKTIAYSSRYKNRSFSKDFIMYDRKLRKMLIGSYKRLFIANMYFSIFIFALLCLYLVTIGDPADAGAIIGSMSILVVIVLSLLLAIFYAPKKLFITTGAAIAFVSAALFFEGFIAAKSFMESIPNL